MAAFRYRVFAIGVGGLPPVVDASDYAGLFGYFIGGISMQVLNGLRLRYRAYDGNVGGPYPWVLGYNGGSGDNGWGEPYAGAGNPLDYVTVQTTFPFKGRRHSGGWGNWTAANGIQGSSGYTHELTLRHNPGYGMDGIQFDGA